MEKVLELTYELKNLLENDPRIINLNKLEEIMKNDKDAMAKSYKKDMAVDKYEFAFNHFSSDSEEVNIAQKELYEAKKELDTCESVANYLKAYSEVRDLYMEINKILFSILDQNFEKEIK